MESRQPQNPGPVSKPEKNAMISSLSDPDSDSDKIQRIVINSTQRITLN